MSADAGEGDPPASGAAAAETRPRNRRVHGLGRGLSALLGEVGQDDAMARAAGGSGAPAGGPAMQTIDISLISPHPTQPRRHFDDAAMQELADSIAQRGMVQPILVRPLGTGYQIVAGERRWRAAQRARLHRIPAIIRELSDAETLEIALIENIQRQDLNAIEEAEGYARLIADFGHSQTELGKLVGKSRSHVANLLRLLDLSRTVQQAVIEGRLSMGHARALIGAPDVERLARLAEEKGLSVREVERLANKAKGGVRDQTRVSGNRTRDPDIEELERHLSDRLGLKVGITHRSDGRGQLVLAYSTLDQLDMLCQRLSGEPI